MIDQFPVSFAQGADGTLYLADGINAVRRWDGVASTTDTAGVIAPTAAVTLSQCGKGPITGNIFAGQAGNAFYSAYLRYEDANGNLSNLSPVSANFRPFFAGLVASASNTTPIAIGCTDHGLRTGDRVRIVGVQGNTAANGLWSVIARDDNNFSLDGSVGNAAYTTGGAWVGGLTDPPARGVVEAATNATPIAVTATSHGLATGDKVTISGALVNTAANGTWTITVTGTNTFTLNSSVGNGAYTANSGYYVATIVTPTAGTVYNASSATPVVIGCVQHGLATNDTVTISGVLGNTAANGDWTATVVDANNFSIASGGTPVASNGTYAGGGTWYGGSGVPFYARPVEAATNAVPIVITSTGHPLQDGDVVTITGSQVNTNANGIYEVLRLTDNTFSLTSSSGNGVYTAGTGTYTAGARAIRYTATPVSGESKVARRQLLRSTAAQVATYYVDIDTTDLSSTTLTSTTADIDLVADTAVPILLADGSLSANVHDVPVNFKSAIAYYLGRLYMAANTTVRQGSCQVTSGSTTVTGVGTNWVSTLAGRGFYVVGSSASYIISSVNASAQTLTLTAAYAGSTDKFALYAIKPLPDDHRTIYYSEAGLADSVSVLSQIELADNGDEITGLMEAGSYLFFLERHHLWRWAVQSDPATDGYPWPVAKRGCVNNRCWVVVGEVAYLLDTDGIYSFSGSGEPEPISETIQDIWKPGDSTYRINYQASGYFHANHFPNQETIRWFVALDGQDLPRHALAYDYRQKRWWIEEYQRPVTSSATGDYNGSRIVYLGSDAKKTLAMWQGATDGPDPNAGTIAGTATSAGPITFADTAATFASSGLVGNPITITYGRGRGQTRRITAVSGTTITVNTPWLTSLDTTSTYQVGGIPWRYQTGDFRYVESEQSSPTRLELFFQPQTVAAFAAMQIFEDFSATAVTNWAAKSFDADNGVRTAQSSPYIDVDLTKANGFAQQRLDRHRDMYLEGAHYMSVQLSGVTSGQATKVYQLALDGVTQ